MGKETKKHTHQDATLPPEAGFSVEQKPEHHCAIVGVYDPDGDPVQIAHILLYHQNHRGQEGAMIAVEKPDGSFEKRGGVGWVSHAFTKEDLERLQDGRPMTANGQDRYSTSGGFDIFQPIVFGFGGYSKEHLTDTPDDLMAQLSRDHFGISHNGNLTNAMTLLAGLPPEAQRLVKNDTGIAFLLLALSEKETFEERIMDMAQACEGAANFVINAKGKIYAYRDPWGFRPLSIGRLPGRGEGTRQGYVVSSENAAFISNNIEFVRDVLPGEGVVIDESGVQTFFVDKRADLTQLAQCVFEIVYFAAPDAVIFGKHVSTIRRDIGRLLAQKDIEQGIIPDIIVPVQHSGISYAEGYAQEMIEQVIKHPETFGIGPEDTQFIAQKASELQTVTALVANIYANGRTFIAPSERFAINTYKHRADPRLVRRKKVVIIDDSLVRGNTTSVVAHLFQQAGASEVHGRFGVLVRNPCFMGVDFATKREILAHQVDAEGNNVEKAIAEKTGLDSVRSITPRELIEIVTGHEVAGSIESNDDHVIYRHSGYCGSCIIQQERYPVDVRGVYSKTI